MRAEHTWMERTEDGEKREIRATKFGGVWRIQSQTKGENLPWVYHDPPSTPDLEALLEVLKNKYQRNRVPFADIEMVERLLRERDL